MNEKTYQAFAADLLAFIGDSPWDSAQLHIETVWQKSTTTTYSRTFNGKSTVNDRFPSLDISGPAADAACELRNHHFKATGQRIWALTFTLHPDGKFKIDYDYNRPEWYTEEDELADATNTETSKNDSDPVSLAIRLNNLGADVELVGLLAQDEFFSESLAWLREQTAHLENKWGLGSESKWNLDLDTGLLTLSFQDGHVIDFAVQIIGTYNTVDSTLMWAWDHPSVPLPLRKASETLHHFLAEKNFNDLTKKTIACLETDAWIFTAAAAKLTKAIGAYRGNAGDIWVYMSLIDPAT
jgi:hypothetical protein